MAVQDVPAAASSSSAVVPAPVSDSDRRVMLHVLLLFVNNGSAKVSRKLASAPSVLPVVFRAADECVAEFKAAAAATDTTASVPGTLNGVPAWINIVLALGAAVSQLQVDVTPPPPPPRERRTGGAAAAAAAAAARGPWPRAHRAPAPPPIPPTAEARADGSRARRERAEAIRAASAAVDAGGEVGEVGEETAAAQSAAEAALAALQAASDRLLEAEEAAAAELGLGAEEPGDAEPGDAEPQQTSDEDAGAPMDEDPPAATDQSAIIAVIQNANQQVAARHAAAAEAGGAAAAQQPATAAGAQNVGGKPEEFAQARLGPHWQLCGMLGEENERTLTALCCDLIDVLHKFAACMPQPLLTSLTEAEVHACMHPRSVLFNVLQLLIQLGRRWDNARRLSDADCVEKLLSMPVPALCTGSMEDITIVLQQIMEDPVHTYPVRTSLLSVFFSPLLCVLQHRFRSPF